jgi:hypothetical protein
MVLGAEKIINHMPIWKESGVGGIKGHLLQGEVNRVMKKWKSERAGERKE